MSSCQLEDADADAPLSVLYSRRQHGSSWKRQYKLDVAPLPGRFAGTGDLLAALLLGWSCHPDTPPHLVLRRAVASIQSVLRATAPRHPPPLDEPRGPALGLSLVSSIDEIRAPPEDSVAPPSRLDAPLAGVIFDMDGTLVSLRSPLPA